MDGNDFLLMYSESPSGPDDKWIRSHLKSQLCQVLFLSVGFLFHKIRSMNNLSIYKNIFLESKICIGKMIKV